MLEAKDIRTLYECWVFDPNYGTYPACLVCSELPRGVEPGEKLQVMASFDAYFFKRYGYEATDQKPRLVPLFLGRSLVLPVRATPAPPAEEGLGGWKSGLVLFLGGVLATFVVAFAGHWWYQRADRRVRAGSRGHGRKSSRSLECERTSPERQRGVDFPRPAAGRKLKGIGTGSSG